MIGSILKEVFILILLSVAIVLTLGVLFYDYIPTSKIVPTTIAYVTPTDIKEGLSQTVVEQDTQKVIKTYQIEDVDLRLYQSTGSYNKGKANPFADYAETITNSTNNTNTANPGTNTTVSTNKVDTNTVGNFFENTGNK